MTEDETKELRQKLFDIHLKRNEYLAKTRGEVDPELEKEYQEIKNQIARGLIEEKIGEKKR